MTESRLQTLIKNRNVVFITVKNKDYIRVRQLERICLKDAASLQIISSERGNPLSRAIDIKHRIKKDLFEECEILILGFLPQLIFKRAVAMAKDCNPSVLVISDFFLSIFDTVVLDRRYVGEKGFIAKFLRRLDKRTLEDANLVITDTKSDADFFAEEFGVSRDKFEVLYLEADEEIYFRSKETSTLEKNGKKIALYFGTGLPLQGTDVVLEAFRQLITARRQIICIYVGGFKLIPKDIIKEYCTICESEEDFEEAISRNNGKIVIIKWLSQEKLSKVIDLSDICLAGHFNSAIDKADRTIPGKAYIYEAMGKTMILGDTKANRELFLDDDKHHFVTRGDSKALAECVAKIVGNYQSAGK